MAVMEQMVTERETNSLPLAEPLKNRGFPEVGNSLRAAIPVVVREWTRLMHELVPKSRRLEFTQLEDHLPAVLGHVGDAVSSSDAEKLLKLAELPAEHGVTRANQDFDIRELLLEYRALRLVLVKAVEDQVGRELRREEDLALDSALDLLAQQAIVQYVNHQSERLRAATEAESKFLSFISHDLRNNLNSITLSLEMLRHRLGGQAGFEDAAQDVELAQQSILETMGGMERLLQAERLRHNVQPHATQVDLRATAMDVARALAREAARKGVEIRVEVPAGLVIRSDREWINLVLQNLVNNGVKYSSNGAITIAGRPHPSEPSKWAIEVSDNGPGIAPEKLSRIFEAFQRGDTHGQKGVGLGLAIALQAARLLGGHIEVESELGKGSTFRLLVPELR